jgi:hypothetical protein
MLGDKSFGNPSYFCDLVFSHVIVSGRLCYELSIGLSCRLSSSGSQVYKRSATSEIYHRTQSNVCYFFLEQPAERYLLEGNFCNSKKR